MQFKKATALPMGAASLYGAPAPAAAQDAGDLRRVTLRTPAPGQRLPLMVEPADADVDLCAWAAANRALIEARCLEHGAILFRGFGVTTPERLTEVITAISGEPLEYRERSSPRSTVDGNIYTSTDYPASLAIFPHNEHSYALTFPLRLFFSCAVPSPSGGDTPLADTRRIHDRLSPAVRERFAAHGWMYVRNFGDGFGLPWQTVFQTDDPAAVEAYCRANRIECEWRGEGRLRTRQVRPAVARHPRTGETLWFNHATFFNVSTLDPALREGLLAQFGSDELPNNTFYGDGTEIEPEVLDELRSAYLAESVRVPWQRGDLVMLDNMLTSHARDAYEGERRILFGMAEPYTRTDV